MILENVGLEVEVCWDKRPCAEEGNEAQQRLLCRFPTFLADFYYVESAGVGSVPWKRFDPNEGLRVPLDGVEHKYHASIDHKPFIERQFVEIVWDESMLLDTYCLEHRLLPETSPSFIRGKGKDNA